MSQEKVSVPIPVSEYPTRVEVWYRKELNRFGNVEAGSSEIKVRLPAAIHDCVIKIIPCDPLGNPAGEGTVYEAGCDENCGCHNEVSEPEIEAIDVADVVVSEEAPVEEEEAPVEEEEAPVEEEEAPKKDDEGESYGFGMYDDTDLE